MRAAVLHAPGPPAAFSLEDVPVPKPGRNEVLIEVTACGVSSKDVLERNGTYRRDMAFPIIIGMEICGVVVERGEDVSDLEVGDRICTKAFSSCGRCRHCRNGHETTCLNRRPVRGGYGQFAAIDADACVRLPPEIPDEIACTLGPASGVALNAVRDAANVLLGETVLVTGATGGVGVPVVQLARAAGARVIALTRSAQKAPDLKQDGAHEVVVASPGEDFSKSVRALTAGEGVNVVIDTVGSRVFKASFDSLALHGRYICVGQLFGEEISINPARIFFKRARIIGVGSVSRTQLEDTVRLTAWGLLRPRIAKALPLNEIAHAHELVEQARVSGRVVLRPLA